jgi:hypothetical protein
MAHRATVLMEKDAPKRAGRGSRASAPRAIPVDLRKVVAPYKHQGRLTVRAEQMPPLARFSAGRNNGDNSWSFAMDELEDLLYLPGTALDEPVTLTIRVIAQDSTVAVLDYDITPEISISVVEPGAPSAAALEQLRNLREELADMALRLAAREADLDAARSETKIAQGELAQLRATANAAPAKTEREIREAIAKAEKIWQAGEAVRLAAAQARWREQSEQALAQLHGTAKKTDDEKRSELVRLTGELATLRKQFAERDSELVQSRATVAGTPAEMERAIRDAISKAEESWNAGEAQRLAAAEERLREQSDRALADARIAAQKALDDEKTEREKLNGELAALRARLAERETDVAKLQSAVLQAGARQERNLQDALETWKAGETVRIEAAHAHWKTQAAELRAEFEAQQARVQSEARAHAETQSAQHEAELRRLNNDLASFRQLLAARDGELAQSRAAAGQAQTRAEQEIDIARANAERDARERFTAKLAEAVARYETAEATLGEMRRRAHVNDEAAVLRDEINTLRMVLANREAELAQARLANVRADGQGDDDERPDNSGFIFSALALACTVMAAILFYPQIVPMLPYDWQVELANFTGAIQYDTNAAPAAKTPQSPAAPVQQKATVAASVNLRAEASAKSDVKATLQPGAEVAEIRQSGNWTFVEARAGQKAQTGWVYNSFLRPEDSSPKTGGH